jgi:hypothetical protein
MMTAEKTPLALTDNMTTGTVTRWFGAQGYPVKWWHVRRVYELGYMPEPSARLGTYRMITRADMPALVAAMKRAGYLPEDAFTRGELEAAISD